MLSAKVHVKDDLWTRALEFKETVIFCVTKYAKESLVKFFVFNRHAFDFVDKIVVKCLKWEFVQTLGLSGAVVPAVDGTSEFEWSLGDCVVKVAEFGQGCEQLCSVLVKPSGKDVVYKVKYALLVELCATVMLDVWTR